MIVGYFNDSIYPIKRPIILLTLMNLAPPVDLIDPNLRKRANREK